MNFKTREKKVKKYHITSHHNNKIRINHLRRTSKIYSGSGGLTVISGGAVGGAETPLNFSFISDSITGCTMVLLCS